MATEIKKTEIANQFLTGLRTRDWDLLKSIMADEIPWNLLSLNNTARRGDLVLDEHLATVIKIRDGKISAIDSYLSGIDMLNAFFVSK